MLTGGGNVFIQLCLKNCFISGYGFSSALMVGSFIVNLKAVADNRTSKENYCAEILFVVLAFPVLV